MNIYEKNGKNIHDLTSKGPRKTKVKASSQDATQMLNQSQTNIDDLSKQQDVEKDLAQYEEVMSKHKKIAKTRKRVLIGISALSVIAVSTGAILFLNTRRHNNSYISTYIDYNIDGLEDTKIRIKKGTTISGLEIPTLSGYRFEGWYSDAEYTIKLKDEDLISNNGRIYAKYIQIYQITLNINGVTTTVGVDVGTTLQTLSQQYDITTENSCGWFMDENYTIPATALEFDTTLYTKHATLDKLSFVEQEGETYMATYKDLSISGEVVLPMTYNNKPVTSVKFYDIDGGNKCENITSAVLTTNIKEIPYKAFIYCTKLSKISLPQGLTSIGDQSLSHTALDSIILPQGLVSIGDNAFFSVNSTTGEYRASVESLVIPSSVTTIKKAAFSGLRLKSIEVESGNTVYDSRNNCNAIIETATNTLITGCSTTTVPEDIEKIGEYAFKYIELTSIDLSKCVNLTELGNNAFYMCKDLTDIDLSKCVNLTTIGTFAFTRCESLCSIQLIGCEKLTSIKDSAFSQCENLTEIVIPRSVTSIESGIFSYCDKLTSIKVESGNTVYDSRNNCNAIIETATNTLVVACPTTIVPTDIKKIGWDAFAACRTVTSIDLSGCVNLTFISQDAFWSCRSLTSIIMPEGVWYVSSNYNHSNETQVDMSDPSQNVTYLNSSDGHIYLRWEESK